MSVLPEGLEGYLVVGFYAGLGLGLLEFASNDLFKYLVGGELFLIQVFLSYIFSGVLVYLTYGLMLRELKLPVVGYTRVWGKKNLLFELFKINVTVFLVYLTWKVISKGVLTGIVSLLFAQISTVEVNPVPYLSGDSYQKAETVYSVFILMGLAGFVNCIILPVLASSTPSLVRSRWLRPGNKARFLLPLGVIALLVVTAYFNTKPVVDLGGYNIVLIIVDTLRADHVGAYGYTRDTTPNVDEFAGEGILFRRAYSTSSKTTQSVGSIMTGLYPHNHQVRSMYHRLDVSFKTLAERLKDDGYTTAAFIRNPWLRERSGFHQGFDHVNVINPKINELLVVQLLLKMGLIEEQSDEAGGCTDDVIEWLHKNRNRRFFMWIHYMDPHWRYTPPSPFESLFDPGFRGEFTVNDFNEHERLKFDVTEAEKQLGHAVGLYDGEIAFNDKNVGRLLDTLKELEVYDNTLIIYTSDHGEEFGEHDAFYDHGPYLYDEEVWVPLIVKLPGGGEAGKVIETPVSLIDITQTILEVAGSPYDLTKMDGGGLMGVIKGLENHSLIYAESENIRDARERKYYDGIKGKWRMVVSWPWKLILIPHPDGDIIELYNLVEDPLEKTDLSLDKPDVKARLEEDLREWMAGDPKADDESTLDRKISRDQEKILKDLGYIA
jgi:arylsulfatase A-like enzyme